MSGYNGFFVRDTLGQVPGQTGSSFSTSPDVILAGATPPPESSEYTTPAGYATDFGSPVYVSTPNFVYLRALNTNPGATPSAPVTGRAWFYWVETDLALWPQNWRGDLVTVSGNSVNYQDIVTSGLNEVDVTFQPFIWTPPPPNAGTHYCAISWIENVPSNPPSDPKAGFGELSTWDDLVNFVLTHPNMGWRNSMDVGSLGYTWSQTAQISGPLAGPSTFYVGIQCTNMPTDGQVGFQVPGPTPQIPSVIAPVAPITSPNMSLLREATWPAGAASTITVDYRQGATPPPAGSSITITLTVPVSALSEGTRALAARAPEHVKLRPGAEAMLGGAEAPGEVFVLGAMTYRF